MSLAARHTQTHPVRVTYYSPELVTSVRHTVGHQGFCACGWGGSIRKERSHALDDSRRHWREEHKAESATGGVEAS